MSGRPARGRGRSAPPLGWIARSIERGNSGCWREDRRDAGGGLPSAPGRRTERTRACVSSQRAPRGHRPIRITVPCSRCVVGRARFDSAQIQGSHPQDPVRQSVLRRLHESWMRPHCIATTIGSAATSKAVVTELPVRHARNEPGESTIVASPVDAVACSPSGSPSAVATRMV